MREIKFRALIKNLKKLDGTLYNKIVEQSSFWFYSISFPFGKADYEYELMQYTGLKDKNGVEIYEGDIVRVIDDVGYYGIGKIIFNLCSFCFEWRDDTESNIEPMITIKKINLNQELEILGNIYENKELLND